MKLIDLQSSDFEEQGPQKECALCSGNLVPMPQHLKVRLVDSLLGQKSKLLFRCEECGTEFKFAGESDETNS
jgi:RNase P subunit RPR2